MPRESVHWSVLDKAAETLLKEAPAVSSTISSNLDAARLGAMAHDAAYYFQLGGKPTEEIAACLHGSYKNDTFQPLLRLAKYIVAKKGSGELDEAQLSNLWAFLLGMVSHFATDVTFHPMIYWFTGDYYDYHPRERVEARRRHRLFETYLEVCFADNSSNLGKVNMLKMQKSLRGEERNFLKDIVEMLDSELLPKNFPELSEKVPASWQSRPTWGESLKYLAICQVAFRSSILGFVFRGFSLLFPRNIGEIDALFCFARRKTNFCLRNELEFKNPVTGEKKLASVNDLHDEALALTVDIFKRFEVLLNNETGDIESVLSDVVGVSLNYGIEGCDKSSGEHFSDVGVDLRGLNRG